MFVPEIPRSGACCNRDQKRAGSSRPVQHSPWEIRMLHLMQRLVNRKDERGASAVEYGLLVAAIAALIVVIVFALGGVVREVFTNTCDSIQSGAAPSAPCLSGQGPGGRKPRRPDRPRDSREDFAMTKIGEL